MKLRTQLLITKTTGTFPAALGNFRSSPGLVFYVQDELCTWPGQAKNNSMYMRNGQQPCIGSSLACSITGNEKFKIDHLAFALKTKQMLQKQLIQKQEYLCECWGGSSVTWLSGKPCHRDGTYVVFHQCGFSYGGPSWNDVDKCNCTVRTGMSSLHLTTKEIIFTLNSTVVFRITLKNSSEKERFL